LPNSSSVLTLIVAILAAACSVEAPDYDVLIVNGTVYDGSLSATRIANIGIVDDRIVSMAASATASAVTRIDATGRMVTPGFIDPHTHARQFLLDPASNSNLNYLYQGVTTVFIGNDGGGFPDRDASIDKLRRQGTGPNVAFFAGHGAIRELVMGMADRAANSEEIAAMQELLVDDMEAGALGLSSGLYYAPGSYAPTEEVIALARVAAHYGGVYDTHLRSEGSYGEGLLAAVSEAIDIARAANIPLHISHIKALGQDTWGQSVEIIRLVERGLDSGVDISANQYPWSASGTRLSNALIPRWVVADSNDRMRDRLTDPELSNRIRTEMQANLLRRGGPDAMLVTGADSEFVGMTLEEISRVLEKPPLEAAIDVVLQGDPSIASFVMDAADIRRLAVQPWVMTGSDGGAGHPRLYGTYPKAFRDFVVDSALMSREQFVHRSSGLVAETFGLCDRGYLREGYIADIAIIDADTFIARASYARPTALATGVDQLLVNGVLAIDGASRPALPGRVLRKTLCN
tara:strand:- start:2323 stop:3876 length:1554 start_codon:yes stop_codon:yes gene_type:complete